MQFQNSSPVGALPQPAATAKTPMCDQCQAPLGEKMVLTRDGSGATRRFCCDDVCVAAWQQNHHSVFRRP
jgi:hypothetical protein